MPAATQTGPTRSARSIHPRSRPEEKIDECERRYFAQGLPSVFKLTDAADPGLDETLERRGYERVTPTCVMSMELRGREFPSGGCVLTSCADDEWLGAYFSFSRYTDAAKITAAKRILEKVKGTMLCGRTVRGGAPVACGAAVIERGYAGLLNIVVDEPRRGKGFGRQICASLLAAAIRLDARTAYLQVVRDNQRAVNLYTKKYLDICRERYGHLPELELHRIDLMAEKSRAAELLRPADLVTANLLVKHIHLDNFMDIARALTKPIVSVTIQFNPDGEAVSRSAMRRRSMISSGTGGTAAKPRSPPLCAAPDMA